MDDAFEQLVAKLDEINKKLDEALATIARTSKTLDAINRDLWGICAVIIGSYLLAVAVVATFLATR